jgi:membrane dipeptidase
MENKSTGQIFGCYEMGLSQGEERRAALLHSESIVIDMLLQGPCTYRSFTPQMEKKIDQVYQTTRDPNEAFYYGVNLTERLAVQGQFPDFKVCWDESGLSAGCRQVEMGTWQNMIGSFGIHTAMFDHLTWMIKALKASDIQRAKAEGKHSAWLSSQLFRGVEENFINLLEPAYDLGLRLVQLTYNTANLIGSGCTERNDTGVTPFGIQCIDKMNRLGIIIDTAHCGRKTTLDACKLSTKPVVATHTCAEGVFHHARAKSDEEIKAIAATGGVIGIVTLPFFLASPPSSNSKLGLEVWFDHVDYLAKLVGWQSIGIGTDWPMSLPKSALAGFFAEALLQAGFRKEHLDLNMTNLDGFDDYRDFPNLTRGLVKRGYSDEQIRGILGENFLRVFEEVCG